MEPHRHRHRFQGVAAAALATLALLAPAAAQEAPQGLVRVERFEVRHAQAGAAVLLLVGSRAIPVFVDPIVAQSIEGALGGEKFLRPLTHDLMVTLLKSLDASVSQVVITLHDGTYYGALSVASRGGVKVFDSRSSDAIALAIHFKAPVFVSRQLLDAAGIELKDRK